MGKYKQHKKLPSKLIYRPIQFIVVEYNGGYVRCRTTGRKIPIENLLYWNIERQEPYCSAEASLRREIELKTYKQQEYQNV